jgi:hypothetical protein
VYLRFWREIALLVAIISWYGTYWYLSNRLDVVVAEKALHEQALDFQNASLLKQKEDYEKKLSELPKEIEKITVRYKVIYQGIDDWKGDDNATDCENANSFLRSINY